MKFSVFVVLLMLGIVAGCSGETEGGLETHPVTGVVTYLGKPEAEVVVTFHAQDEEGVNAQAVTNQAGEFTVFTSFDMGKREQEGMVAGRYRVTAIKTDKLDFQSGQMVPKDLLPARYRKPQTSGLEETIVAGEKHHLILDLKK